MSESVAGRFHACIVESDSPGAREEKALELAAAAVCSGQGKRPCSECRDCRKAFGGVHPDVIYVRRGTDAEGKSRRELYVDQIRAVSADAPVLPNEAEKKVYVLPEADLMNTQAQNAFLKLLEEPPAHVAFVLCAQNAEALLETIRSRCALVRVNESAPVEISDRAREFVEAVSSGSPEKLVRFCVGCEGMDNREARDFTREVQTLLSEILCLREPACGLSRSETARLMELVKRAEDYLRLNVGVKHVFGLLQTAAPAE